jgi:D-alanyl-D-alanine carboxypeptidase
MVLLVNKKHMFNEIMLENLEMIEYDNYKEDFILIERETFYHFEMLKAHLKIDGIIIDVDSAYRSLEAQENVFLEIMNKYGIDYAEQIVAMPGMSEHHTGQAIDIVLKIGESWITDNDKLLEQESVFNKIHSVLNNFGFILRYPNGKDNITGYPYEPWHIRYVGLDVSMNIGDMTLEEYLERENSCE